VLRVKAGLTQRQLAQRVNDLFPRLEDSPSEQYIRRAEKGLVGEDTDLSKIIAVLVVTIKERNRYEDRISVDDTLSTIRGILVGHASEIEAPRLLAADGDLLDINDRQKVEHYVHDWFYLKRYGARLSSSGIDSLSNRTFATAKDFRHALCGALGVPDRVYGLCSELGLHIFVVQRFEGNRHFLGWPKDYRKALVTIGLDPDAIKIGVK
jgi:transcriptional regulator with XRE-family HTH domain